MLIEPNQKILKSRLRKEMRHRRASIGVDQRIRWNEQINHHLEQYVKQALPRVVAAYMAFDGEPDLIPSLTRLGQLGVRLALPAIQDAPGKAVITMREWGAGQELTANRYGIAEPAGTADVRITDIGLVLIPLVGWDRTGNRLGMGASFYDRLFQPFAEAGRPLRVGVGYELQCLPDIPREPWDIQLHGMLTESGLLFFKK